MDWIDEAEHRIAVGLHLDLVVMVDGRRASPSNYLQPPSSNVDRFKYQRIEQIVNLSINTPLQQSTSVRGVVLRGRRMCRWEGRRLLE